VWFHSRVKRILVLSLLPLAAAAGVAWAATGTSTPGSACVGVDGTLDITSDGAASNATAASITAMCPVERRISPTVATKISGTVYAIDRSTSGNVCCRLISKNPGSETLIEGTQVCSSGNGTSSQALALPQLTDPYSFSHFAVRCTLPPINTVSTSQILMYTTVQP
jgi:hypothetical protein